MSETPSKFNENSLSILGKRKRSPNLPRELGPSSMTLRKRMKKSVEVLPTVKEQNPVPVSPSFKLSPNNLGEVRGASFVRFEILERKG